MARRKEKVVGVVKEWSPARLKAFIVGSLRQGFRRYPPKYRALANACVGIRINKATKRKAAHYTCAECTKCFPRTGVQIDHKVPAVRESGFVSWDDYIERLFCDEKGLQILCRLCHKKKTQKENQVRRDATHVKKEKKSRRSTKTSRVKTDTTDPA